MFRWGRSSDRWRNGSNPSRYSSLSMFLVAHNFIRKTQVSLPVSLENQRFRALENPINPSHLDTIGEVIS